MDRYGFRMDHEIGKRGNTKIQLNSKFSNNSTEKCKKGEQVKADLPLEDETETARTHRPLALLPRRTEALGTGSAAVEEEAGRRHDLSQIEARGRRVGASRR
jgi:hypothetical protein